MSNSTHIFAEDCSPITDIKSGSEEDQWLRDVCAATDATELTIRLSEHLDDEPEPLAYFDSLNKLWYAGRYVGEISYKGRTLQIVPRFGMPTLKRWLSRIWGIKLLPMDGEITRGDTWLWLLLAYLWSTRLISSARHGLPTARVQRISQGRLVRGRLRVRDTSLEIARRSGVVVSTYRERSVDPAISSILVAAHDIIEANLRRFSNKSRWLTVRAQDIITRLKSFVSPSDLRLVRTRDQKIHFSPITELYRPIVELSKKIVKHQPISGTRMGKHQVYGVLLDIAEIWEHYVFHELRTQARFAEHKVIHTGRDAKPVGSLLGSNNTGLSLGSLFPDICISHIGSSDLDYIVDAKYKPVAMPLPFRSRPQREDLYQMTSYIAALGKPDGTTIGLLVYPAEDACQQMSAWVESGPWFYTRERFGKIEFLGLSVYENDELREASASGTTTN